MKRSLEYKVLSVKEIAQDTVEMIVENKEAAQRAKPGQFLHVYVEGHTLRRPISIAETDEHNGTVTILFKKLGDGTIHLAAYRPGMILNALGPNGNGFAYDKNSGTSLLIGGGIGIPPLYHLGKALQKNGITVRAVLGFQSATHVFYEEAFQALGDTWIVTNDGSYGHKGLVTDVFDQIGSFDMYYSCGPTPMLKAVTEAYQDKRGYISLEERMGCGVGACFACVIPAKTASGYRKICQDGPVFAANEVMLA